mmetsp:Transcript_41038/g.88934  ORF Transcript_41038/g.88934 Transcript_41038/m.88934 type:complete len:212 (-) Transcript_41038:416-1051(-)
MPRLRWCHCLDDSTSTKVIQQRNAELRIRFVIAIFPRVLLAMGDAALLCPFDNGTVRQLDVLGILFQKLVQPVKGALVWNSYREDNLILSVLWRRWTHLSIRSGHFRYSQTFEWQWRKRRSKVYMQCGVLEADMRKEWLSHQVLWELLRLRCSNAILEQADCVGVGARSVQVQQHSHGAISLKSLRHAFAFLICTIKTVIVEVHTITGFSK